jgi:pimeloyl-ACP methyl ester carboxylesterase
MSFATICKTAKMAMGIAIFLGSAAPALSQSATGPERQGGGPLSTRPLSPPATPSETGPARVNLLRGLMNVFSLGMDDLAQKLEREGIPASVRNHIEEAQIVEEIAGRYRAGDRRPIILIGHSLGADAVMLMSEQLGRLSVPVSLVVLFDGTQPMAVGENVARVLNITQHVAITPGPGFHGEIETIDESRDASVTHTTIDKSASLQAAVIGKIRTVLAQEEQAGQANAPIANPPAENSAKPESRL